MYIKKAMSYGRAWDQLISRPLLYKSLVNAISELTIENISRSENRRAFSNENKSEITTGKMAGCWEVSLEESGWIESREYVQRTDERPIHLRSLGHIQDRVSVSLQFHREILNRWLFTSGPIAYKNGLIDIPVAVVLLEKCSIELFGQRGIMRAAFERTLVELSALSPLSHGTPFLILGLDLGTGETEVFELESDNTESEHRIVINRAIEFPPEYHQAGLGILSYFGTVLREKYPNEKAKVRIEQEGDTVRMIVESETGNRDIIEKALHDYELVIRGEAPPEALYESKLQVLELKNELRIAQIRIESQKDLLQHKSLEIDSLKQLIGHALTQKISPVIQVTASPVITLSNHTEQSNQIAVMTQEFEDIAEDLQYLAEFSKAEPGIELRIRDLEEALRGLASKNEDKDLVRTSPGLKKLRDVIIGASETGSALANLFNKTSDGLACLQGLGRKYNKIASWCGAPTVPEILLGKS